MSETETLDMPFDDDSDSLESILSQSSDQAPDQIGPYKILSQLGEGGFGIVYEAQQEQPIKRRVALKVIKPGMDTNKVVARFEAERQALALMTHTSIAKVLDGGITDRGLPYFVMDLVKGLPITDFCTGNKLSIDDRLKLLITVCEAIQHAHAKAVIHRDLKPSNILVGHNAEGEAVPTVIDFGIAKALDDHLTDNAVHTAEGQLIGTPEYMSPEQAETSGLDIDTRTDVYSLGVVLYELLTGMRPFESSEIRGKTQADLQRFIKEVNPPKPSIRLQSVLTQAEKPGTDSPFNESRRREMAELPKQLRGELDWIVMKCLEKDRDRRYATPLALAEELEHYLNNEPVLARPPSTTYRMSKLVKRNKSAVAAVVFFAVILIVATAVSVRFSFIADAQRTQAVEALSDRDKALDAERLANAQAQQRAEELKAVADFQSQQLSDIDPELMGARLRAALIESLPSEQQQQLNESIAKTNFTTLALGSLEDNIFSQSIAAIDEQFQSQPAVHAQLLQSIASTATELGLFALATDPQQRATQIRRQTLGDTHQDTLESLSAQGDLLRQMGDYAGAQPLLTEALAAQRESLGDTHPATLRSISSTGDLYLYQFNLPEAAPLLTEALQGMTKVLGPNHPDTLNTMSSMGGLMFMSGKLDDAETYFRAGLNGSIETFGQSHPDTWSFQSNLGILLKAQGKYDQAEPFYLESLASISAMYGENHLSTLSSKFGIGELYREQNKLDQAQPYLEQALTGQRQALGNQHPTTLSTINSIGLLLQAKGDLVGSEQFFRESLAGHRKLFGDDNTKTLVVMGNTARVLADQDKLDEAETLAAEAITRGRAVLPAGHWNLANFLGYHAQILIKQGQYAQAEPELTEAHTIFETTFGPTHPRTTLIIKEFINLYTKWHETEPTAGYDTKAADWQSKLDTPNEP